MAENAIEVNEMDFDELVLQSDLPVLVDFWAEWCGPCKMIEPIVDDLATEYDGKLRVAKIDADANGDILMNYGVMSIPTLLLFHKGEVVGRVNGFKPKGKIVSQLNLTDVVG